jgi:hypothetical protein
MLADERKRIPTTRLVVDITVIPEPSREVVKEFVRWSAGHTGQLVRHCLTVGIAVVARKPIDG